MGKKFFGPPSWMSPLGVAIVYVALVAANAVRAYDRAERGTGKEAALSVIGLSGIIMTLLFSLVLVWMIPTLKRNRKLRHSAQRTVVFTTMSEGPSKPVVNALMRESETKAMAMSQRLGPWFSTVVSEAGVALWAGDERAELLLSATWSQVATVEVTPIRVQGFREHAIVIAFEGSVCATDRLVLRPTSWWLFGMYGSSRGRMDKLAGLMQRFQAREDRSGSPRRGHRQESEAEK